MMPFFFLPSFFFFSHLPFSLLSSPGEDKFETRYNWRLICPEFIYTHLEYYKFPISLHLCILLSFSSSSSFFFSFSFLFFVFYLLAPRPIRVLRHYAYNVNIHWEPSAEDEMKWTVCVILRWIELQKATPQRNLILRSTSAEIGPSSCIDRRIWDVGCHGEGKNGWRHLGED